MHHLSLHLEGGKRQDRCVVKQGEWGEREGRKRREVKVGREGECEKDETAWQGNTTKME